MKQPARRLFLLLCIATGAITPKRTIKSIDVARESYKDPPVISIQIKDAT